MKYLFIILSLAACSWSEEDHTEQPECVAVQGLSVVCSDPRAQGLFSSASCFSLEEAVEVMSARDEALSSGVCSEKQQITQAEPRNPLYPEIVQ